MMDKKHSFAIIIPTYNRMDLLFPALLWYTLDFPNTEILVYVNGYEGGEGLDFSNSPLTKHMKHFYPSFSNLKFFGEGTNEGVSVAWNKMLKQVFEKHDYALVLNDDIYLGRDEAQVQQVLDNHYPNIFICQEEYDWSAFLISKETFEAVGDFDEHMVLYCSDNDYMRRMVNLGYKIGRVPFLNPSVFRRSMTLLKDTTGDIQKRIELDRAYYKEKWGGLVGSEQFMFPFDNEGNRE